MSFLPLLTRWSHSTSLRNFLYSKMRGFQASWTTSPVHSICTQPQSTAWKLPVLASARGAGFDDDEK